MSEPTNIKAYFRDNESYENEAGIIIRRCGIVDSRFGTNLESEKDLSVIYVDPITGEYCREWRGDKEVELTLVDLEDFTAELMFDNYVNRLKQIGNLKWEFEV